MKAPRPPSSADPLTYLFSLEQYGIKLGLSNIRTLTAALDHPEHAFTSVLVAGTNGKGSVAAMLERGLRAAGYRTGLYTSPHLVDLAERIAIDGQPVDTLTLGGAAHDVRRTVDTLLRKGRLDAPPTFFEATTTMALSVFRAAQVRVAVLEVGMGGRFDATNVVTPVAVAVPTIDLDHQRYLGTTVEAIAFEKAGVISEGAVVVTGETKPAARDVLYGAAEQRGARFIDAAAGTELRVSQHDGVSRVEALATPQARYGPLTLALRGGHQIRNAVVAVRLLEALETAGLSVPPAAIRDAMTDVRWRGRLELLTCDPTRQVLLDTAHNVAAATALGAYVREVAPGGLPFVFGALEDKDVVGMVQALGAAATAFVCTPVATTRARKAADLAALVHKARPDVTVSAAAGPQEALAEAWTRGPLVCASGSVYLVGELIRLVDTPG